jgi:hypothetical protein
MAAALLVLTTLFLGIPSIVYAANPGEFAWPFANIVESYAFWAVAVCGLLVLPAIALPPRFGRWWAAVAVTAAIYVWAHGVFQTHSFGQIDGREWSASVPRWQVLVEGIAILACAFAIWLIAVRRQALAVGLVLFLSAGMAMQVWPVLTSSRWIDLSGVDRMAQTTSFSPDKNVLVVLMDTMTADVFEEVVKASPELKAAFDGFLSFPDTTGVAPSTYLTMPTIHSGRIYENGEVLSEFFDTAVRDHSVLTKLADAGYETVLINPIRGTCPRRVECFDANAAMRGDGGSVRSEASRIMDATLFRLAPLGLKEAVYNNGQWVVQSWTNDPRFAHVVVAANSFLEEVSGKISVGASRPTLKFIHSLATHPPYVYRNDCKFEGRQLEVSRANFVTQVRCSLGNFALLLKALRDKGIYDRTAIILIADHGNYQVDSSRTSIGGTLAANIASANPTFAIKPIGNRGDFRSVKGEVHIGDFGATLCDLASDCEVDTGFSALAAPAGRTRVFNYYRWRHEYWEAKSIPDLTRVEIVGPIEEAQNWAKVASIDVGETIFFNGQGTSHQYVGSGWSGQESWGTWTDGNMARLIFYTSQNQPLVATLMAHGFTPAGAPLRVLIDVDGSPSGELVFEDSAPKKWSFDIPAEAVNDGRLEIDFHISDPRSPEQLGLSEDSRGLGMGMHWMRLDSTDAFARSNEVDAK